MRSAFSGPAGAFFPTLLTVLMLSFGSLPPAEARGEGEAADFP